MLNKCIATNSVAASHESDFSLQFDHDCTDFGKEYKADRREGGFVGSVGIWMCLVMVMLGTLPKLNFQIWEKNKVRIDGI